MITGSPTLPRLRSSPIKRQLTYDSPLRGEEVFKGNNSNRIKTPTTPILFTMGQVVAMVALGASFAAILTALVSVHSFSTSYWKAHADALSAVAPGRRLRPILLSTAITTQDAVQQLQMPAKSIRKVVWLMSFPNSGTSFTIHMTREATNCTTATNYGLEGEIRDKPSVQAIDGPAGALGPWLELIPGRTTNLADTILTKTHCKGFCSGSFCGPEKTFHTPRSFMQGCLTGNQGIRTPDDGLKLIDTTYDKSLVHKAIHIFRHPLDNVVARFHLEYNEKRDAGDKKYTLLFPKNATGFRRWCALDDMNKGLLQSRFVDRRLRAFMQDIPCFNEFYRYTQWHNLAFTTTRAMNLTTMILHYHEYSDDFVKARDRVLNFLELPLVGEGIEFHAGKVYRHYYSQGQREAIRQFLQEFATAETWEQLKDYDFDFETSTQPSIVEA